MENALLPNPSAWTFDSFRVSLHTLEEGDRHVRERCPHWQHWFLFAGEWGLNHEGLRSIARPGESVVHAPARPCVRSVERSGTALSLQLYGVDWQVQEPTDQVRWEANRTLWHLALELRTHPKPDRQRLESAVWEYTATLAKPSRPATEWAKKAHDLVSDLDQDFSIEFIANQVGISPNHLCAGFKQAYGVSIGRFRRRLRVERALRSLNGPEPAWLAAGFFDPSHLRRAVKEELGLSTAECRVLLASQASS